MALGYALTSHDGRCLRQLRRPRHPCGSHRDLLALHRPKSTPRFPPPPREVRFWGAFVISSGAAVRIDGGREVYLRESVDDGWPHRPTIYLFPSSLRNAFVGFYSPPFFVTISRTPVGKNHVTRPFVELCIERVSQVSRVPSPIQAPSCAMPRESQQRYVWDHWSQRFGETTSSHDARVAQHPLPSTLNRRWTATS